MNERKKEQNDEDVLKNIDLIKALNYNRFHHFLFETKKYKDFYWSKEAFITLVISIFITSLFVISVKLDLIEAIELANTMVPIFIGGMLTILGLSLAGLAIVSGTLGEGFLTTLIRKGKLYSLLNILFSFYFAGFIIGITLFSLTSSYIVLSFKLQFHWIAYITLVLINVYLVFFSIIYSVMLLGTCIRLFLLKYSIGKMAGTDISKK